MGVTIIADSGCDLTKTEASSAAIDIIPVWIALDGKRLRDGVDVDRDSVLARIGAGEVVRTEPPSVQDFTQAFTRATAGGNDAVMIVLSSQISQSFAYASEAAQAFGGRVQVVDSRGASGLESLLALYAVELMHSGLDAAQIAKKIDPSTMRTAAYFAVPDVSVLGRSGRLPKAVVALGSMLNVSLVLKLNEHGAIGPAGQSFSFDKTCEIMVEAVVRAVGHSPSARVAFGHVQAPGTVAKLSKLLADKLGHPPVVELIHEAPPTLVAHIGTGAIGIFAIVPS